MVKRNLAVGIMMTREGESKHGCRLYQTGYAEVLGLTRNYLNNPTEENERQIYESLRQFSRSALSFNAVRRVMRIRLFLFQNEQQRQARKKFQRFFLIEQELEANRRLE